MVAATGDDTPAPVSPDLSVPPPGKRPGRQAPLDVVHVTDDAQAQPDAEAVLETVRANDLVNVFAESRLHEVYHPTVLGGVLEEAARQEADLLVLVARRHSLLGSLFHRSVTAQLIQESPIPVLILPAEE